MYVYYVMLRTMFKFAFGHGEFIVIKKLLWIFPLIWIYFQDVLGSRI